MDLAILLCCFNNFKLYSLEYSCLIISILILPSNLIGLIKIWWNYIEFYGQIIYSLNISISIFSIFIICLIIYSTKDGRITSQELYQTLITLSMMSIIIYIYLFISYSFCLYLTFKNYINIQNQVFVKEKYTNYEIKKMTNALDIKSTWIYASIATISPCLFALINTMIWISIYYRIYFRIFCSFKGEIRKELWGQKRKNKKYEKFQDVNTINSKDNKKCIQGNDLVSVIIERDRHPNISCIISNNTKNINQNSIVNKNIQEIYKHPIKQIIKNRTNDHSEPITSSREFEKSNNIIY